MCLSPIEKRKQTGALSRIFDLEIVSATAVAARLREWDIPCSDPLMSGWRSGDRRMHPLVLDAALSLCDTPAERAEVLTAWVDSRHGIAARVRDLPKVSDGQAFTDGMTALCTFSAVSSTLAQHLQNKDWDALEIHEIDVPAARGVLDLIDAHQQRTARLVSAEPAGVRQ